MLENETTTCIRAGYGNFDTADVEQRVCGRTLIEILARCGTGEYRLITDKSQWISCEKFGVRMMRYVEWWEYSRRPSKSFFS